MAISNPVKNAAGNWVVTIGQDGAQASKTLSTKNTYVDGDIILNEPAATQIIFGNQPATGKQASSYTTIDDEAPVLISGDYLYVNEGYRGDVKISLSKLVPDGSDVAGHGDYILKGHSAYDNAGTLVAGTIETRTPSTTYYTSSDTGYGRIDIGYIANAVSIKAGDLNPTATVATQDTALTSPSSIDKQYVKITPKDIPSTAGWVTTDGETGTVLNYKVKDGAYSCTVEGAITANATATSANMATIAKPSSGTEGTDYFSFTATPSASGSVSGYAEIITAGWLPTGQQSGGTISGTVGSTDKKYVAKAAIINNTTLPSGSSSSGTINRGNYIKIAAGYNKTDLYYLAQANSGDVTITKQSGQSVDGYATASVQAGSATPSATLTGATGLTGTVDVNAKQFTVTPTASVGTAGWISSIADGTVQKYEVLSGSASGTATVEGSSSALTSPTAMNNQYFKVTPGGTVSQAGWISSISAGTTLNYKVKDGAYTCTTEGSITANAAASTNMAIISKPSSGTEGTDYFSITATPSATGTINGYAEVTAAGWIPTGHASGSSKSAATGSADKKYVAKAVITNNTTLPSGSSSSGTINRGKYIKIAAGYNKTDLYYLAQANSGNVTITQQSGQSVDGYATASVQTGSASVVDKSQTISSDMTISGAITTSGSATVYRVTSAINKEYSGALTGSVSAAGWITSVASANLGVVGSKSLDIAVYNGEVA